MDSHCRVVNNRFPFDNQMSDIVINWTHHIKGGKHWWINIFCEDPNVESLSPALALKKTASVMLLVLASKQEPANAKSFNSCCSFMQWRGNTFMKGVLPLLLEGATPPYLGMGRHTPKLLCIRFLFQGNEKHQFLTQRPKKKKKITKNTEPQDQDKEDELPPHNGDAISNQSAHFP